MLVEKEKETPLHMNARGGVVEHAWITTLWLQWHWEWVVLLWHRDEHIVSTQSPPYNVLQISSAVHLNGLMQQQQTWRCIGTRVERGLRFYSASTEGNLSPGGWTGISIRDGDLFETFKRRITKSQYWARESKHAERERERTETETSFASLQVILWGCGSTTPESMSSKDGGSPRGSRNRIKRGLTFMRPVQSACPSWEAGVWEHYGVVL